MIHALEDDEKLCAIAFIDVNVFNCKISAINNYLLFGDTYKSIAFCGFQEEPARILVLGKDVSQTPASCVDFLSSNLDLADDESKISELGLFLADDYGNIHVFNYAPKYLHTKGGKKLIRSGDIYVGSPVVKSLRLGINDLRSQGLLLASSDGSIHGLFPISEKKYRRFQLLSTRMLQLLPRTAGCNPKAFR